MAELESNVRLIQSFLNNPVIRKILLKMTKKCNLCGDREIGVALDVIYGDRKACWRCTIKAKFLAKIIAVAGKMLGADQQKRVQVFKDPHWRKGLVAILTGIAKFGALRPFVPGAPFQVVWDITYRCNLSCKHCYASAGKAGEGELSTEEVKYGIDKLADSSVCSFAFSGGEPLMRKDILELARYAADKGMYVAMATNGTLITKEKAKKMKEAGIRYLQISLDGAGPETHDNFRGLKGVFAKTITGIKNAVEQGFFVNIAMTGTRYNYKEIPKVIDLCGELGANWFMMFNFVPTGRGKFILQNDLNPGEREELLKILWYKLKTTKKPAVLSTAPQLARVAMQAEEGIVPTHFANLDLKGRLRSLTEFIGGCGAGRCYLAIEPNGDIQPCVFFPLKVGNIIKEDFEDLWQNSPVFKELRDRSKLEGHCGICDYKYYCGGCRARAWGYLKDYRKPDPGCINNRILFEQIKSEL